MADANRCQLTIINRLSSIDGLVFRSSIFIDCLGPVVSSGQSSTVSAPCVVSRPTSTAALSVAASSHVPSSPISVVSSVQPCSVAVSSKPRASLPNRSFGSKVSPALRRRPISSVAVVPSSLWFI